MTSKKSFLGINPAEQLLNQAREEEPKHMGLDLRRKETKSARLNLLLTPTLKKRLELLAVEQGNSVNDVINQILEAYTKNV